MNVLTYAARVAVTGMLIALLGAPVFAQTNDFDRDGRDDVAVYRPSDGVWYIVKSAGGHAGVQWGTAGDVPVTGDYDGDGQRDVAVWRPGTGEWYIVQSRTRSIVNVQWGAPGDRPVPGDYDGDGRADMAVWRPSDGVWYILTSRSRYKSYFAVQWGSSAALDVPVPEDFDGDGSTDLAVWRPDPGLWFVKTSKSDYESHFAVQWGLGALGDVPVAGDFDGDGHADVAVWRPSDGVWYVKRSGTSYRTSSSIQWGVPGDIPVLGDYDGDGKADPTVFRPSDGTWYQRLSRKGNVFATAWGRNGDLPLSNPRKRLRAAASSRSPVVTRPRRPVAPPPASPPPASGSSAGKLRVMTWNIHFGKTSGNVLNLDTQARVMADSNADVILLQEVSTWDGDQPNSLPAKLQALTGRRWSRVWSSHNGSGTGEGTMILTRLPIVSSSIANYYNRGFSRVAVNVNGVTIDLFNGHLEYYDRAKRTNQLRSWMAWMDDFAGPEIAGGDFNSWWGESWIKTMETEYSDTWQDVTGSDQNGYTHHNVRFDYLFRARNGGRLSPTSCRVVSTSASDHRPVVAEYAVK